MTIQQKACLLILFLWHLLGLMPYKMELQAGCVTTQLSGCGVGLTLRTEMET